MKIITHPTRTQEDRLKFIRALAHIIVEPSLVGFNESGITVIPYKEITSIAQQSADDSGWVDEDGGDEITYVNEAGAEWKIYLLDYVLTHDLQLWALQNKQNIEIINP